VGGATTARDWGPMYREQLRGHLRFLAKDRGLTEAERARWLLLVAMLFRSLVFTGDRRKTSFAAARWLSRSSARELLA
jgi:truncated hemoglobin YjbI